MRTPKWLRDRLRKYLPRLLSTRVTDTVYLDALPLAWDVEEIRCPQATPGSVWCRRYLREVTSLEMQIGFEYLRIGDTHRYHETELWCTVGTPGAFDNYYRTPSGRTVWRRHRPTDLTRKLRLP
jgi:hypothetical protein